MKNTRFNRFLSSALLISAVAFLPACNPVDWMKEKMSCGCSCAHEAGFEELGAEGVSPELLKEVVVEFDGKPVATGADYERTVAMLMEAQPAFRDMLPYLPKEQADQIYDQLAETLAFEKIILRSVEESGVKNSAEYKKNAKKVHEAIDRDLAINAFQNELLKEIAISDEEAKNFYEENRASDAAFQRPPFATAVGGIKAEAFEAGSQKAAQELAEKARHGNFASVAKDAKKSVVDYGVVNQQSMIDKDIKDAILKATTFPKIQVVRGANGKYFVVRIISKQDAAFADFDSVKDAVKQMMTSKKFNDLYQKRIAELKDAYKVVIHKDYLEKRKPKAASVETQPTEEASVESKSDQKNI